MSSSSSASSSAQVQVGYVRNEHLARLPADFLYHLGMATETHDFPAMFGDVKFVCVGGTGSRMEQLAYHLADELQVRIPTGMELKDLSVQSHRYSMFKVGPVLCVSHGMGTPSLSILLHELIKLIHYAKCSRVTFIRIGTCGGIGLEPGTVAISNGAVDGLLQPFYDLPILGKLVRRPVRVNQDLVAELKSIADDKWSDEFKTEVGVTMCALDFYEAQGRLDGAFCHYSEDDKMKFLQRMADEGIVNIEMEAVTFFALCTEAGIDAAVICVTIVNRLDGDQVRVGHENAAEYQRRPGKLAADFIRKRLGIK